MEETTDRLISSLKALADPVRLRLLALCSRGECTVSELTRVVALSQPRVSQHLKQLCDAGLLQRFRDGHFVYYRLPLHGEGAASRRALLALLPADEPWFTRDYASLCELRMAAGGSASSTEMNVERQLHRALIELTVSTPLGDVIDIGCGQGSLLKLLASRARRAVGVDIDADARQLARAELFVAGVENCSLRQGDMYALPFAAAEFDTVIVDDVLGAAERPTAALAEASRLLKPGGRLILLAKSGGESAAALSRELAEWCNVAGLRLSSPRRVAGWMLAIATRADGQSAAA